MMALFNVTAGVNYEIEAEDEKDALDKAFELIYDEWGRTFARYAWMNAEEIQEES